MAWPCPRGCTAKRQGRERPPLGAQFSGCSRGGGGRGEHGGGAASTRNEQSLFMGVYGCGGPEQVPGPYGTS